jgi:WD repeat-containing protein 70
MQLSVTNTGVGAIVVKWQAVTNQIFCTTSSGSVTVLYDPRISKKGAMLAAARAPRREKDPGDFVLVGEIYNPHALLCTG